MDSGPSQNTLMYPFERLLLISDFHETSPCTFLQFLVPEDTPGVEEPLMEDALGHGFNCEAESFIRSHNQRWVKFMGELLLWFRFSEELLRPKS